MKNFLYSAVAVLLLSSVSQVSAQSWSLTGNAATDPTNNFIGTTDAKAFRIRTNNVVRMSFLSSGKTGIGIQTPLWKLDVKGGSINTDSAYRINGNQVLNLTATGLELSTSANYVGIGTATPSSALEVKGMITASGGTSQNWNTAYSWGNHAIQGYLKVTGLTTNYLTKWNGTTLVNSSLFDSGTNVGIGTASPSAKLHVSTTALEAARFNATVSGTGGLYVSFYENNTYRGYIGSYAGAASDVDFGTGAGNTTGKVHLTVQATPQLTLDATGNIGFGTTSPFSKLHIVQTGTTYPSLEIANTTKGPNVSWVHFDATGDWYIRSAANAGKVIIQDQDPSGVVAIGSTYVPAGYKMSVAGKVICTELKVQLQNAWPDYVFNDTYKLKDLQELKSYINEYKHLPGINSAAEMQSNDGVEVGQLQQQLLEKIEELTLYVIHQQEQIDALTKQLNAGKN